MTFCRLFSVSIIRQPNWEGEKKNNKQQTKHKKPLFSEATKIFYPHFLFYFVYYTLIWSDFWSIGEKILTRKLLRGQKIKGR